MQLGKDFLGLLLLFSLLHGQDKDVLHVHREVILTLVTAGPGRLEATQLLVAEVVQELGDLGALERAKRKAVHVGRHGRAPEQVDPDVLEVGRADESLHLAQVALALGQVKVAPRVFPSGLANLAFL